MRYEARDPFVRCVLELIDDPPFTIATFRIMRDARPIMDEIRVYDSSDLSSIVDDL